LVEKSSELLTANIIRNAAYWPIVSIFVLY
jgi:hypothetical protein